MHEVLERRLKHQNWVMPDLILIDGGEPQLRAVADLLDPTGIPYIGIAKRDMELVIPKYSVREYQHHKFSPDSHIMKLIKRIDDESHRFAITYHTLLKRKTMLK